MDTGADNSEQWYKRRVTRKNTVRPNLVPKSDQHEFRRNFFSSRVIGTWNSLPEAFRNAPTVSSFKRLYRRLLYGMVANATCNTKHFRARTSSSGVLRGTTRIIIQVIISKV